MTHFKKYLVTCFLLILFSTEAHSASNALNGSLEAQWSYARSWENKSAAQLWLPTKDWQPELSASWLITQNGFGIGLDIEHDCNNEGCSDEDINDNEEVVVQISDLYLDFSSNNAEWTVGRKPQEWSYAFSDSQLNWINAEPFLMREQYLSFGSWQLWCAHEEADSNCGTRLSGWWSQADWQIQFSKNEHWKAGVAAQTTIGSGGLFFTELHWDESAIENQATQIMPSVISVNAEAVEADPFGNIQLNIGGQWTTKSNFTIQLESLIKQKGLSSTDWKTILNQIDTQYAGLVSDAFEGPFGKQQHLVRVSQTYKDWSLENVLIYWPDANQSWLNQTSVNYQLNTSVDIEFYWQHAGKNSALGSIGMQDTVAFTIQFKDGF